MNQNVKRRKRPTTTFNGQANSVTLVANLAVNQMARLVAVRHCQGNQRTGRLAADVERWA